MGEVRFCRTCGEVLNVAWRADSGTKEYLHSGQRPGRPYAHVTEAVRLADLGRAPVIRCDFCGTRTAVWAYQCADQLAHHNQILRQDIGQRDYTSRHGAARARRTVTERRNTQIIGDRWSACDDCATVVQSRDLLALIWRGVEGLPGSVSGKRLIRLRAELHGLYQHVLDTLQPGRAAITPEHPFGHWPDPNPDPTNPDPAGPDRDRA